MTKNVNGNNETEDSTGGAKLTSSAGTHDLKSEHKKEQIHDFSFPRDPSGNTDAEEMADGVEPESSTYETHEVNDSAMSVKVVARGDDELHRYMDLGVVGPYVVIDYS